MKKTLLYFKIGFNTMLFLIYEIIVIPLYFLIWLMRRLLIFPFVIYIKRREQPFWYTKLINTLDDFTEALLK